MPIKKLTVNIPMMLAIDTDKEVTAADVKNITESVAAMLRDGFFSVDNVYDASYQDDVKLEDFTFGECQTMEWVDKQQKESDSGENVPEPTEEEKAKQKEIQDAQRKAFFPYADETEEENEARRIKEGANLLTKSELIHKVTAAVATISLKKECDMFFKWSKDADAAMIQLGSLFRVHTVKTKDDNYWKVHFNLKD